MTEIKKKRNATWSTAQLPDMSPYLIPRGTRPEFVYTFTYGVRAYIGAAKILQTRLLRAPILFAP